MRRLRASSTTVSRAYVYVDAAYERIARGVKFVLEAARSADAPTRGKWRAMRAGWLMRPRL